LQQRNFYTLSKSSRAIAEPEAAYKSLLNHSHFCSLGEFFTFYGMAGLIDCIYQMSQENQNSRSKNN
jgi:hypothetical protein